MAPRPFDEEELSISLSPSQIRRNNRPGRVPEINVTPHSVADPTAANNGEGRGGGGGGGGGGRNRASSLVTTDQNAQSREKLKLEQRIGAYNIIRTLGEGSFGKVKLAVHRMTGQQVALKVIARKKLISRDMVGRVEREIEYLQLLRHPHIIKL